MPRRIYPRNPPAAEKELLAAVTEAATLFGWDCYHTLYSKGSEPGFPDCVLVKPPQIIVAELKKHDGVVTEEQQRWLDMLAVCGIEIHIWRPANIEEMVKRLSQRPR